MNKDKKIKDIRPLLHKALTSDKCEVEQKNRRGHSTGVRIDAHFGGVNDP